MHYIRVGAIYTWEKPSQELSGLTETSHRAVVFYQDFSGLDKVGQ